MQKSGAPLRTGIYFLKLKGAVVYVGQTTRFPLRLYYHDSQNLPYDDVKFIECAPELLDYNEQRWIKYFKPEFNVSHNREKAIKKIKVERSAGRKMTFRRLSRLSRISFGPYTERTVEQMLLRGKKLDLIKMYYQLSHISFLDDVLADLLITEEWRIEKPGVNKDMYLEFAHAVYPNEMDTRRDNAQRYNYRNAKQTLKQIDKHNASKIYHRRFNQKP